MPRGGYQRQERESARAADLKGEVMRRTAPPPRRRRSEGETRRTGRRAGCRRRCDLARRPVPKMGAVLQRGDRATVWSKCTREANSPNAVACFAHSVISAH